MHVLSVNGTRIPQKTATSYLTPTVPTLLASASQSALNALKLLRVEKVLAWFRYGFPALYVIDVGFINFVAHIVPLTFTAT